MKTRLMILIITGIIATSCAKEYTYTPPQSEDGKACVSQCQTKQNICRQNEHQRAASQLQKCKETSGEKVQECETNAQKEFSQCEHDAKIEFKACQRYAPTLSARGACIETTCYKKTCLKQNCFNTTSYSFCDSEFRNCFQQCGGSIGVLD